MTVDSTWVPVASALVASSFTLLGAFGLDWRRARREGKGKLKDQRQTAYARLLAATVAVSLGIDALRVAVQFRSGLVEDLAVVLRLRRPVDPFDITDRLRADHQPLLEAWSDVWTIGTPAAVVLANRLLTRVGDLADVLAEQDEVTGRVRRVVLGPRWSDDRLARLTNAQRALGVARKDFAELIRTELGIETAELFSEQTTNHEGVGKVSTKGS